MPDSKRIHKLLTIKQIRQLTETGGLNANATKKQHLKRLMVSTLSFEAARLSRPFVCKLLKIQSPNGIHARIQGIVDTDANSENRSEGSIIINMLRSAFCLDKVLGIKPTDDTFKPMILDHLDEFTMQGILKYNVLMEENPTNEDVEMDSDQVDEPTNIDMEMDQAEEPLDLSTLTISIPLSGRHNYTCRNTRI